MPHLPALPHLPARPHLPTLPSRRTLPSRKKTTALVIPDLPDLEEIDLGDRGKLGVRIHRGPVDRRRARRMPPLVLIHGWTVTANLNYFRLYEHLAERHTFVAFDQRGHGVGLRPAEFTLEDCADDVIAVADALGWPQIIPVGYSMGGTIAQLVAHHHRDRVAGLVLCSTAAVFSETRGDDFFFESILGNAAKALSAAPKFLRDRVPGRFRSPDPTSPLAEWMEAEYGPHDAALVASAGQALGRFRSEPWLSTIDVPTAVVITTGDNTVPPTRQRQLAAMIPAATSHLVDLDHRASASDPEQYWPVLDEALASVAKRQPARRKGAMAATQAKDNVHHLFVSGRVQNVGFRDSMQRRAKELGVKGWVRNRRDGRVEAVVAGAREKVDELLEWARQGPPLATVTDMRADIRAGRATDADLDDEFEVRPTE
jgi:3-oxoadipate enol-lactonase